SSDMFDVDELLRDLNGDD
nr:Chain A, DREB2A [Arabidopsis thaliana]